MSFPIFCRRLLVAALAGLAGASALDAQPAATGPWAKVPALPTACYSGQDQWWDQNNAALEAVQQARYKQAEANAAIHQKLNDAMAADPMAMVQALQQKMMDDPQNAQKYIEQMVAQGQQAQAEVPAQSAKEQQLEAESKTVIKQYEAALTQAMGPANARWNALKKKMGISMDSLGPGELGVPDWAWAEWEVILRERDSAYAANCAKWWTATGQIHAYMKRYKDYLVQERTPYLQKFSDQPVLDQFKMMDISSAGYRTTADYEAAEDYIKMASTLFDQRNQRPHCTAPDHCE